MSVLTNAFAFCKNNSRKAIKSVNKKKKKISSNQWRWARSKKI